MARCAPLAAAPDLILKMACQNSVRIAAVENREHQHVVLYLKLSETVLSASVFAQPATTDDCLVIVTEDSDGSRSICLTPLDDESSAESSEPDVLVAYSAAPASHKYAPAVTASASLAGGRLIIGDSELHSGRRDTSLTVFIVIPALGSLSLLDIETDTASSLEDSGTERASPITCILPCEDAHGDVKIYAGTTDGQVSCWQIPYVSSCSTRMCLLGLMSETQGLRAGDQRFSRSVLVSCHNIASRRAVRSGSLGRRHNGSDEARRRVSLARAPLRDQANATSVPWSYQVRDRQSSGFTCGKASSLSCSHTVWPDYGTLRGA